jgi:hypothetical protein
LEEVELMLGERGKEGEGERRSRLSYLGKVGRRKCWCHRQASALEGVYTKVLGCKSTSCNKDTAESRIRELLGKEKEKAIGPFLPALVRIRVRERVECGKRMTGSRSVWPEKEPQRTATRHPGWRSWDDEGGVEEVYSYQSTFLALKLT